MRIEKVLGFRKKDAVASDGITLIYPKKLVPVVLASESVSIKWLKNYCKKNTPLTMENGQQYFLINPKELMCAVRKQAQKKEE